MSKVFFEALAGDIKTKYFPIYRVSRNECNILGHFVIFRKYSNGRNLMNGLTKYDEILRSAKQFLA